MVRPTTSIIISSLFSNKHLVGVLNDPDVFLSELVPVKCQQPLRDLRKAGEFRLFVYVLLPVLLLKEVLQKKKKMNTNSHSRTQVWQEHT